VDHKYLARTSRQDRDDREQAERKAKLLETGAVSSEELFALIEQRTDQ
jgi:hypothetical protein